jgi:threonine synthase
MKYVSTRGAWAKAPQSFLSILLEGLAPDGGLAVPKEYPTLAPHDLEALAPLDYRELALAILSPFMSDIPRRDLARLIERSYTREAFGSDEIVSVRTLEPGLHLLRVSNGPTLSFKDIAMQLLGNLFEYALEKEGRRLTVLGATSGDTGSAAEYALRGKRGVDVFMLSPNGRMSPFQQAQMYTLQDPNIHNVAIDGTFDDCQDIVKALAGDAEFKRRHALGAVNSINWARVAAQVVYYFKGYFAAKGERGGPVAFAVPSGNFGNILAGYVARMMGLPIGVLILATNENDVLDEFFRTGRYRPRAAAETHATSSPSMDISKASNFERFIFEMVGRDATALRELWQTLERDGGFDLSQTPHWDRVRDAGFLSGSSTHADRIATIREIDRRFGVVIDPHTADGMKVGLAQRPFGMPLVVIETALPAKFSATLKEALGREPERPPALADLESRPQRRTVLPADVDQLRAFIDRHASTSSTHGAGPG